MTLFFENYIVACVRFLKNRLKNVPSQSVSLGSSLVAATVPRSRTQILKIPLFVLRTDTEIRSPCRLANRHAL